MKQRVFEHVFQISDAWTCPHCLQTYVRPIGWEEERWLRDRTAIQFQHAEGKCP